MVKGRGKGKKLTATNNEDRETGEDEKISSQKRRGRPEKPLKDEIEEVEKVEDKDGENAIANDIASIEMRISSVEKNNKKRKRNLQSKETTDSAAEKYGNNSSKSDEFRHNGSRRKNKPCRAAEAGVICR